MPHMHTPDLSELGKRSEYDPHYNPNKLFPIARSINREKLHISPPLPFFGFDIWNHYEVSWLNEKGKPMTGLAEIIIGCDSPNIIESKSMKLYFNSFNNTKIKDEIQLESTIKNDLEARLGAPIMIKINPIKNKKEEILFRSFDGLCVDDLDIECEEYAYQPQFLSTENKHVEETLYSDLLKSNCLVTQQPDWGSVQIRYKGYKINREGLLRYIVSYRNCNDFSEQCIERIFMDILHRCKPEQLFVYGRFTRRGGIDINPCRSTKTLLPSDLNNRFCRQ